MNGALTIGTLDGANVEMLEAIGAENMFIFGLTADRIQALREDGSYRPRDLYQHDPRLKRIVDAFDSNLFSSEGARAVSLDRRVPARPRRHLLSSRGSAGLPRRAAPGRRHLQAAGDVGVEGDSERGADRQVLERSNDRGVRQGHLGDRGRLVSWHMLSKRLSQEGRRLRRRDAGHRRGDGHRRAVSRHAERHDRRAGLLAGGAPRRDRVGKLAGVDGVSARRAVLQLLLPAARLHADDRGPAELGRARRVSRHRRHGRPAVGAGQAARGGGGGGQKRNQAGERPHSKPARGEPRCARHDRIRRQDQRRQFRHRDADRPFTSGPHRHGLLGVLHRTRAAPAPSIARCFATASCAIVGWSFATGTGT